jgi:hypothetical protein
VICTLECTPSTFDWFSITIDFMVLFSKKFFEEMNLIGEGSSTLLPMK